MSKLHVLVDSREPSVSLARSYFREKAKDDFTPGQVKHIREKSLGGRLKELDTSERGDEILISVHYLFEEQLQGIEGLLKDISDSGVTVSLASYDCFEYMIQWCRKTDFRFVPNSLKRRLDPEKTAAPTVRSGKKKPVFDQEMHERIWVQYRLMLAIIARSQTLDDVCGKLIPAKMIDIQKFDAQYMADEYTRALRFFRLGEPDMAGGSYSDEENDNNNPNVVDELRIRIKKIAATDFNVLVSGESGSGKEAVAWSIHELSARPDKPFIAINCAGLPDELLESEMFGYMKGSHN